MMHSIRWQLVSVCCHLTCQHCGERIWCGMALKQLTVKDEYRQIQTNTNMLACVKKLENSSRRDIFSPHAEEKKSKAALAVIVLLTGLLSLWGTASHASLFASIFTGFNTSVPCHIPEHIQISPWHFTHRCVHCFIIQPYYQSHAHMGKCRQI